MPFHPEKYILTIEFTEYVPIFCLIRMHSVLSVFSVVIKFIQLPATFFVNSISGLIHVSRGGSGSAGYAFPDP